jgi:serine/threonine-protein kinase 40
MWAVGVLLYTMLYGQFPFYDGVPEELFRRISAADYCIPRGIPCSFEVQTVIEKLLELDSRKRMTVSALIQELECIMSQWSVALSYANPSSAQVFIQCC